MGEIALMKTAKLKLDNRKFTSDSHIRVYYQYVRLEYGNAVAISYALGDLDRRPITIGHDQHGKEVELCLGKEWPVDDVVHGLARIFREHSREEAAGWTSCALRKTIRHQSATF